MKGLREYNLSFAGLKNGKHQFEFPIDKKFFANFGTEIDFEDYNGIGYIELDKHSNFMEADIRVEGDLTLICDYDEKSYTVKIENEFPLIIKFGDEYNDEDDEVLVLTHEAYEFNTAQYLYEGVLLSIPMNRMCGDCDEKEDEQEQEEQKNIELDPRWEALKKLKE